jgi:hypothetical protein
MDNFGDPEVVRILLHSTSHSHTYRRETVMLDGTHTYDYAIQCDDCRYGQYLAFITVSSAIEAYVEHAVDTHGVPWRTAHH